MGPYNNRQTSPSSGLQKNDVDLDPLRVDLDPLRIECLEAVDKNLFTSVKIGDSRSVSTTSASFSKCMIPKASYLVFAVDCFASVSYDLCYMYQECVYRHCK